MVVASATVLKEGVFSETMNVSSCSARASSASGIGTVMAVGPPAVKYTRVVVAVKSVPPRRCR